MLFTHEPAEHEVFLGDLLVCRSASSRFNKPVMRALLQHLSVLEVAVGRVWGVNFGERSWSKSGPWKRFGKADQADFLKLARPHRARLWKVNSKNFHPSWRQENFTCDENYS